MHMRKQDLADQSEDFVAGQGMGSGGDMSMELHAQVSRLESGFEALKAQVSRLESGFEALKAQVSRLESAVELIKANMTNMATREDLHREISAATARFVSWMFLIFAAFTGFVTVIRFLT